MQAEPTHRVRIQDKKKLVIVAFFVFCLFSLLILQFFKIQVVECDKWQQKARAQHQFTIAEPFHRGVFYSSGNLSSIHEDPPQALVVDLPMFHVYVDPESLTESSKEPMMNALAPIMGWNEQMISKVRKEFDKKSRSRKIATWITHEHKEEIETWWKGFARRCKLPSNAIYFVQDYKRSYPYGKMLGQVLHTIREDKDVLTHQAIPTGGLEYSFNQLLQGKEGQRLMLRSPKFSLDRGDVLQLPQNGHDIYLTIHPFIQAIAEEEIERGVQLAQAKSGWAVVMDVNTGDILAMAQYPFFYPAEYRKYYADPSLKEHTKVKAITDCYEPGSMLKPLSLAIALKANKERELRGEKRLFDPEAKVDVGKIQLPGRKVPMKDTSTARFLNMNMALQKSSNLYIAGVIQKVVDTLGEKWYKEQLEEVFGFGKKTGIELPSETAGFLPSPGKCYPNGKLQWSVPTPGCLAIGYNLLANGVQMLRAYAVIASGGYDIKPSLVKKIVNADNQVVYERTPSRKLVLDSAITDRVIEAMKFVTKNDGLAARADIPGFTRAGKTGTSEKIRGGTYAKNVHVATFIGFTPAKEAKIAILVGIDEPPHAPIPGLGAMYFGGKCAAPVFGKIATRVLQYLGTPPDDPDHTDMVQEVKTLKNLFWQWNKR